MKSSVYIVRTTNGKCCSWCSKIAGRYDYATAPEDIFRRHDNCACQTIYECGNQRQDVWSKKSWNEKEIKDTEYKPKKLSPQEADAIEKKNLKYKGIDKSDESGIKKENTLGMVKKDVHNVGIIDIDKYKDVTNKKILSDEVIITNNRIDHIIERRGQQFYDEFHDYFAEIVKDPDYIFKDNNVDTAIVSKTFVHKRKTVNIVLKLVVESENPNYKNSIITAIGENEKRFAQRLRNSTLVYKKFDKNE